MVPDVEALFMLLCEDGEQSLLAASALKTMGYNRVAIVTGGWRAMRASLATTWE